MNNSALQKHLGRGETAAEDHQVVPSDAVDDLVVFGWLRGLDARSIMLDLRKRNGNRLAIAYSWVSQIAFDPSTGMVIVAADRQIKITGQNLATQLRPQVSLYDGLVRHRVVWIREADKTVAFAATSTACVVDSIEW